ncbi:MAG TPA: phenylalanine--tRNA ligase subunit beta [Pyrinomonadaceae bacterium]|nr:phenylalanine--tRNA ligase subunit beta [Pyrinomonadaceae bacterium]
MNISYNWLKDLIDIEMSADEVAAQLTRVGLAVEGIHPHGDDFVLDIDLTSNRSDCLSHLGIARELQVINNSKLIINNYDAPSPGDPNLVNILDANLCNRFTARIIRNVKIGPSPQWLVNRLEAIGERSINNVADITNYVMHELGQPMHSFDLDKLSGGRIVVRKATPGEKITTLDEVDRVLDETMLAICDAEKPVAIGGVMGGLDSSITDSTVSVLLEVAYFKRENIRATSRTLGLGTEASYRFERGVDIENLITASNRATELICELAGGKADDFVDVYPNKFVANQVASADISASVKRLTGLSFETGECVRILTALGITASDDRKTFSSPTWRHDIAIEEDLVEEVARHAGYENIANELPPAYGAGEYQKTEPRKKRLRENLADMGFDEAITYSFIDTRQDGVFENIPGLLNEKLEDKYITLQDSVIDGALRMRPSILPGLLDAVRLNLNFQRRDLKLFEIGKVFAAQTGEYELPNEREILTLVVIGGEISEGKAVTVRELDLYDAKGALEAALEAVGVSNADFTAAEAKHLRKGQTAAVLVEGSRVGYIGRLSDDIAAGYKFKQPVYVAEVDLQAILDMESTPIAYRPLSKYPAVTRDVSLLGDRNISFAATRQAVTEQNFELCRNVSFVDVYEGKGLQDNERSITIRLEYRSDERTLIEDEVEALHKQILSHLEQKLAIKPRF